MRKLSQIDIICNRATLTAYKEELVSKQVLWREKQAGYIARGKKGRKFFKSRYLYCGLTETKAKIAPMDLN